MKSFFSLSAVAVACAISLIAVDAHAAVINKNSGATTPTVSDFGAPFAGHPNKVGYNHPNSDGMFLETFQVKCPKGQKVTGAKFNIKVKKLGQGAGSSDNDALAFWDSGAPVFNTYLWTANDPAGTVKSLSLDLSALPAVGAGVINSPTGGDGKTLFSDGDFSFSVQDDTSVLSASLEYVCGADDPGKKGMTFGVNADNPITGTTTLACQGAPASPNPNQGACDPYQGDTPGTTALPVLCIKKLGLPNPVPDVMPSSSPPHWSGGVVATTPAVSPVTMGWSGAPRSQVDAYCVSQFGTGWQVAEFHMGQNNGWKFGAYGSVGKPGVERFWVHINDQPNGNVWATP
jgi:hypothetical protein